MSFLLNYFRAKTPYISDLDLVAGNEYDYIIIGGGTSSSSETLPTLTCETGTSGCVLASRLSEDPNVKVLLLEAGGRQGSSQVFNSISLVPFPVERLFPSLVCHLDTAPSFATQSTRSSCIQSLRRTFLVELIIESSGQEVRSVTGSLGHF